LAQSMDVVSDESGTSRFGLYIGAEGFWAPIETGWSLVVDTPSAHRWLFGFSGD